MKNFVQPGNNLYLVAPVGGVVSGNAYLIGALLVVALHDADAADTFTGVSEGVFELPKEATTAAFVPGEMLFWDNSNHRFDETATGRYPAATAVETAGATATTVKAKLMGHAVTAVPAP